MPTWNLTPCDGCRRSTRLEHGTSATVAAGRLEELEPGKAGGAGGGHTRCKLVQRPRAWFQRRLASEEAPT